MKLSLHFLATLLCYALLDLLWLGVLAKSFVQRQVGFLMAERPDWGAAVTFYVVFTGCLLYLCVYPALAAGSASKAAINGAVFGLATYGTYELVNKALLKDWPAAFTWVDIAWGVAVGAAVAWVSFHVGKRLF